MRALWLTSFFLLGCHAAKETIRRPKLDGSAEKRHAWLFKDTIQQTIRTHLGEVRACYNERLKIGAWQARIVTQFMISPDGSVDKAVIVETTQPADQSVEQCITQCITTWRFPPPNGDGLGKVIITYPFILRTETPPKSVPPADAPSSR